MRTDRLVFAFVERVAKALHPYRWWLFATTIGVWAFGLFLILLGHFGYPALFVVLITPRLGAPLLLTLFTWSAGAHLLSIWFMPKPARASSERAIYLQRIRRAGSFIARAWALFVLAAFVLIPVAMWLVVWGVLH
jgi:hypothetical protein